MQRREVSVAGAVVRRRRKTMTLSTAVYLVCVLSTACSDKSKVSITTNLDPAVKVEILLFGTESLGTFSGKEITLKSCGK